MSLDKYWLHYPHTSNWIRCSTYRFKPFDKGTWIAQIIIRKRKECPDASNNHTTHDTIFGSILNKNRVVALILTIPGSDAPDGLNMHTICACKVTWGIISCTC